MVTNNLFIGYPPFYPFMKTIIPKKEDDHTPKVPFSIYKTDHKQLWLKNIGLGS